MFITYVCPGISKMHHSVYFKYKKTYDLGTYKIQNVKYFFMLNSFENFRFNKNIKKYMHYNKHFICFKKQINYIQNSSD